MILNILTQKVIKNLTSFLANSTLQILYHYNIGHFWVNNTGNESNNNIAVTKTAQTNKGNLCKLIPLVLIFKVVVIKLIAPSKEETPARCRLKIAKSTLPPE